LNKEKIMRRFLWVAILLSLVSVGARGDNLVGVSRTGTLSAAQTNQRLKAAFENASLPRADQAVDFFKVRYNSRDERGRNVVLSGLLALPQKSAPKGLVIFNHDTIADRAVSPSRYNGENKASEHALATLAFASGGYAVIMPDYLGLGDHMGAHSYPSGEVNSRSAVDIISPARTIAKRRGDAVGPQLFVTGYSEGGAVSMWTQRVLQGEKTRFIV